MEGVGCRRCCGVSLYGLAGLSALTGVMLTVFGATGFFQTTEQNNMFIIIGVSLMVTALVLTALGFFVSRKVPPESLSLSPRIPVPCDV